MLEVSASKIIKEYSFQNFKIAMNFVNKVAELAEQLNHHPDIHISYNKVRIESWTHDTGRVTEKDRELMEAIAVLFGESR